MEEKERPQPGTPWEGWLILGRILGLPDLDLDPDEYDRLEALRDEFEDPLEDYPDEYGFGWDEEEEYVAQGDEPRGDEPPGDEPPGDEPLEPLPF